MRDWQKVVRMQSLLDFRGFAFLIHGLRYAARYMEKSIVDIVDRKQCSVVR